VCGPLVSNDNAKLQVWPPGTQGGARRKIDELQRYGIQEESRVRHGIQGGARRKIDEVHTTRQTVHENIYNWVLD
jgi:hypothetical protein